MLPCYYVKKTDDEKKCAEQSITLNIDARLLFFKKLIRVTTCKIVGTLYW